MKENLIIKPRMNNRKKVELKIVNPGLCFTLNLNLPSPIFTIYYTVLTYTSCFRYITNFNIAYFIHTTLILCNYLYHWLHWISSRIRYVTTDYINYINYIAFFPCLLRYINRTIYNISYIDLYFLSPLCNYLLHWLHSIYIHVIICYLTTLT